MGSDQRANLGSGSRFGVLTAVTEVALDKESNSVDLVPNLDGHFLSKNPTRSKFFSTNQPLINKNPMHMQSPRHMRNQKETNPANKTYSHAEFTCFT